VISFFMFWFWAIWIDDCQMEVGSTDQVPCSFQALTLVSVLLGVLWFVTMPAVCLMVHRPEKIGVWMFFAYHPSTWKLLPGMKRDGVL
jgi:hypothetical protein